MKHIVKKIKEHFLKKGDENKNISKKELEKAAQYVGKHLGSALIKLSER